MKAKNPLPRILPYLAFGLPMLLCCWQTSIAAPIEEGATRYSFSLAANPSADNSAPPECTITLPPLLEKVDQQKINAKFECAKISEEALILPMYWNLLYATQSKEEADNIFEKTRDPQQRKQLNDQASLAYFRDMWIIKTPEPPAINPTLSDPTLSDTSACYVLDRLGAMCLNLPDKSITVLSKKEKIEIKTGNLICLAQLDCVEMQRVD